MSNSNNKSLLLNMTQTSLTASVALVLSYIEMIFPDIPFMLPGMKLGLSNIAVMFALQTLSLPSALFICLTKAILALLMRGFTAFLMSLCGSVLSCVVMYLVTVCRWPRFGYVGMGIAGAFFHNFGQILIAFLFTDKSVFAYFPVLSLSSLVTGTVTALTLYLILPCILKLKLFAY